MPQGSRGPEGVVLSLLTQFFNSDSSASRQALHLQDQDATSKFRLASYHHYSLKRERIFFPTSSDLGERAVSDGLKQDLNSLLRNWTWADWMKTRNHSCNTSQRLKAELPWFLSPVKSKNVAGRQRLWNQVQSLLLEGQDNTWENMQKSSLFI